MSFNSHSLLLFSGCIHSNFIKCNSDLGMHEYKGIEDLLKLGWDESWVMMSPSLFPSQSQTSANCDKFTGGTSVLHLMVCITNNKSSVFVIVAIIGCGKENRVLHSAH